MNDDERVELTFAEALPLLEVFQDHVHTFVGGGGMMIGADWHVEDIRKKVENGATLELTGPFARGMKHGIALMDGKRMIALATDEDALKAFEEVSTFGEADPVLDESQKSYNLEGLSWALEQAGFTHRSARKTTVKSPTT